MKFLKSKTLIIGAIFYLFLGIFGICAGIITCIELGESLVVGSLPGVAVCIVGIVMLIVNLFRYVRFDNHEITLYNFKRKKSIVYEDVQRIIIWQIMFHGAKNECIIIDDGTFTISEFAKKKRKTIKEGWIIVEYTNKCLAAIKYRLPNCPIEVITPDQY